MQKLLITTVENHKPLNLAFKVLHNFKVPTLANLVA